MKSLRLLAAGAVALASMATAPLTAHATGTRGGLGDGNGDGVADLHETVQNGRYVTAPTANGVSWFRPSRPDKGPLTNPKSDTPTLFTNWTTTVRANVGLGSASAFVVLPDMTGDRKSDALVRFGNNLYFYKNRGDGIVVRNKLLGTTWGGLTDIWYAGNLNGDSRQYLMARRASDQTLWAYQLNGTTAPRYLGKVGSGFGRMRFLMTAGNILGDRKSDMIGVDTNGYQWCYTGLGNGKFSAASRCGGVWAGFTHVFTIGDVNGDGRYDIAGYHPPTKSDSHGEPDLKAYGKTLAQLAYKDRGPVYMTEGLGLGKFSSRIMLSYDDFQFFLFG